MKRELVSILAIGFPLAVACSSSNSSNTSTTDGGSESSTTGSSSGTTSGTTSGSSSGGATSSGGGDSGGDGNDLGVDCTVTPCTGTGVLPDGGTARLVCCPTVNQCTPPDMMDCASSVWVACTKPSDCENGQTCCVTAATTTGSGPSGSECRTACEYTGANPDQGPGCNISDPNGGLGDCPSGEGWLQCSQVSNSPASLGICLCKSGVPADCAKADGGVKDSGSPG